jgi:hypothetical protein
MRLGIYKNLIKVLVSGKGEIKFIDFNSGQFY